MDFISREYSSPSLDWPAVVKQERIARLAVYTTQKRKKQRDQRSDP